MYIELHGRLVNDPHSSGYRNRSRYPYYHIRKLEELHFELLAITYSDKKYFAVNMPVYGYKLIIV
jgi:hypothetical protein